MSDALSVTPAYGRTYKTTADAEKAFHDGKDFQIWKDGPYMSIRDAKRIKADGYTEIHVYTDRSLQHRTVHVL